MQKIPTIFERNWDGDKRVIDKFVVDPEILKLSVPTEKLDGTNIRLTVRNHTLVRLEKRCNPTKLQKAKGIVDPWYVDAYEAEPSDRYVWEAARNTDMVLVPDGEWNAEAVGSKIQGNALGLDKHRAIIFSEPVTRKELERFSVPIDYVGIREWLSSAKSILNPSAPVEGLVWWKDGIPVGKIKLTDFIGGHRDK